MCGHCLSGLVCQGVCGHCTNGLVEGKGDEEDSRTMGNLPQLSRIEERRVVERVARKEAGEYRE